MKKFFMLTCLFSGIMVSVLHAQQTNQEFLQAKVNKFNTMKNTGIVLTSVGAGSVIGGIILLSGAQWNETSDGYETTDGDAFAGALLTTFGVGMLAGGITCIVIGDKKSKKYKRQLNELSLSPVIGTNKAGLMLTLRF